jgi:apolipoprotein D and lipocalin family protein
MKRHILSLFVSLSSVAPIAAAEVTTVPKVDLDLYLGKWFEVAAIPQRFQKQCTGNTSAEYTLAENGMIKVLNSCDTEDGTRSEAEGRAKVVDLVTNSKLRVTFVRIITWIFAFGGNYWILDLGPDYSYSLVGDPSAQYAWLLSRTPTVSIDTYRTAEAKFRANGYDTCKILTSIQEGGPTSRIPMCELVKHSS